MNHMTHRMLSERQRIRNLHKKGENATEILVVIHLDVCEPMLYMQEVINKVNLLTMMKPVHQLLWLNPFRFS